jgi:peptidylprolyl isomerase
MRKMSRHRAHANKLSCLADALYGAVLAVVCAAVLLIIPPRAWAQTARTAPAPAHAPAAAAPVRNPVQAANPSAAAPAAPAATAPAAESRGPDGHDVIARVGNDNLTADDVRAYVAALDERQKQALAHDPALLSQTVRLLLSNRLVLQEALAKKWEQKPDIAAQLQRIRDDAIAQLYLQSMTAPPADYPSEADIQKVYDANSKSFLMPRQFQLAQIFISVPQAGDSAAEAAAKKRIDDIAAKFAAPGADFDAVAKTGNDASNGGDLGWLPETQVRPEIASQIIGLQTGGVSKPIHLEDGWHIVKLIDTRASYTRTLPEVRDQLVQQMRAERAAMAQRAYIGQLLQQHPPMLNEFALSNLLGKAAQ